MTNVCFSGPALSAWPRPLLFLSYSIQPPCTRPPPQYAFTQAKLLPSNFTDSFFFVAAVAEHSRAPCKGPCCWINKGAHGASCLTAKVKEQVSLSPRRYRQSVAMETDGRAPRVFVPFPERTRSLLTSANSAQLSSFSAFQLGVSPAMALGSSLHSRG